MQQRFSIFPTLLVLAIACFSKAADDVPREVLRKAAHITPSPQHLAWQEMELNCFVHFGMTTFIDQAWEFATGAEDPKRFNPTAFNADQWVSVCKAAGMKGLILTAKHCDGFCLWPSKYTEHSVKNSPWRDGKGDMVKEVADACRRGGIKFGIYLSPWDKHEKTFGAKAYDEFYKNQLRELLVNYGEVFELWWDGYCGGGKVNHNLGYDWAGWVKTVREIQPNTLIFGMGPDLCGGPGNEKGFGRVSQWDVFPDRTQLKIIEGIDSTADAGNRKYLAGAKKLAWVPAETCVSIQDGWFHSFMRNNDPKPLSHLLDIYYDTVGRNTVLLLNVPPDRQGMFCASDVGALRELRSVLDETFKTNLASGKPATASSFAPGQIASMAVDGNGDTYWTPAEGMIQASLEIDLGQPVVFDRAMLQEMIATGQRIEQFRLEAWDGEAWREFARATTIGHKRLLRFPPVTASKVRLNILDARDCPTIREIGLFKSSPREDTKATPRTRLKASDPAAWKPVPYQAATPTCGVTLDDAGLFKPALENNITYLLNSFSVNHMLVPFRLRAGQKDPPDDKPQHKFWDKELRGSSAGRFLMGAGNTLRWVEHPELRKRLNELMDGIEACRGPNGYILAYPPNELRAEEPNYARAWFTHGLIEAAIAGNPKAYGLLRGHADWFNQWEMLPKLINCCGNAHQGHIASTRTYFTPIGKPEDLQVAEKYYVSDWWTDQLTARQPEAIWQYPLNCPHCYLITSFEAYLDHYRAKGDKEFLDAMLGAWDMIHDNWEHVGGSMALCEGEPLHPPKSYYLAPRGNTGETCGSVFWIKFNQRFHQLYPMEEKYVNEIEKSIYNVGLANQVDVRTILSFARMEGAHDNQVEGVNTCCEGQGTRFYGSLPEYIYSTADDGLYVNLYEPSSIRWQLAGKPVGLAMTSKFPFDPNVAIKFSASQPTAMKLRVRVPAWAAKEIPVTVNGQQVAVGKPGTYAVLDRTWADGDTVAFVLPMAFRVTRYTGVDQISGHERYALEYGPLLMAVAGPLDENLHVTIPHDPKEIAKWLKPKADRPLCFAIEGDAEHEYMPYWQINNQRFCVYPVIQPGEGKL